MASPSPHRNSARPDDRLRPPVRPARAAEGRGAPEPSGGPSRQDSGLPKTAATLRHRGWHRLEQARSHPEPQPAWSRPGGRRGKAPTRQNRPIPSEWPGSRRIRPAEPRKSASRGRPHAFGLPLPLGKSGHSLPRMASQPLVLTLIVAGQRTPPAWPQRRRTTTLNRLPNVTERGHAHRRLHNTFCPNLPFSMCGATSLVDRTQVGPWRVAGSAPRRLGRAAAESARRRWMTRYDAYDPFARIYSTGVTSQRTPTRSSRIWYCGICRLVAPSWIFVAAPGSLRRDEPRRAGGSDDVRVERCKVGADGRCFVAAEGDGGARGDGADGLGGRAAAVPSHCRRSGVPA